MRRMRFTTRSNERLIAGPVDSATSRVAAAEIRSTLLAPSLALSLPQSVARLLGRTLVIVLFAVSTLTVLAQQGHAQGGGIVPGNRPGIVPGIRPGDTRQDLLPEKKMLETQEISVLPPLPISQMNDILQMTSNDRVFVKSVDIEGNSVVSSQTLGEIAHHFENRDLSYTELIDLNNRLTRAYADRGYATSGAIYPENAYDGDGVLRVQIIEGTLGPIDIQVDGRRKPWFFETRIRRAAGSVLNVRKLERMLQVLKLDPQIRRLASSLVPTADRGVAALTLSVEEDSFYNARASFDNYRSPSIGSLGGSVIAEFNDLVGYGDGYLLSYSGSEGLNQVQVILEAPVTPWDTKLLGRFQHSEAEIVDVDFKDLDISSQVQSVGFELHQPLYQSPRLNLSGEIVGDWSEAKTEFGNGVSLGTDDSIQVSALRAGFSSQFRWRRGVVALRSIGSFGLGALGASAPGDDHFFSSLTQMQSFMALPWFDSVLLLRADAQWSPDELPSLEQFAIGGRFSVRGYRENSLVKDNGASASAELRIPFYQHQASNFELQFAPFVDWGRSWNNKRENFPSRGTQSIVGAGAGLRAVMGKLVSAEIFWAHNFSNLDTTNEKTIQDNGIHFQLSIGWPK